MKTKIVTAFYTGISNHPYYGHGGVARHERYLHSLRTLNNMNVEIICFCNENQYELLLDYCDNFDLKNVKIKISNLSDNPTTEKMISIKEKTDNFKFYHEVDWNKIFLLEKEYDDNYDYIYWFDVGLSHRGLFLEKYNPYAEKIDGLSRTYENYSFLGIFNNTLIEKINNWVGDKLINLSNKQLSHNMTFVNSIMETNVIYNRLTVGGILGGNIKNLKWFINTFNSEGEKVLNKDVIINHEALISHIFEHNQEMFKTFTFETWYHDDFWKTTPVFDNDSIRNKIHFVHFFEKELGI